METLFLSGNNEADTLYMKELLIVAGLRQADIARDLGVKKTIVNKVILRKDNSARVMAYFIDLHKRYGEKLRELNSINRS